MHRDGGGPLAHHGAVARQLERAVEPRAATLGDRQADRADRLGLAAAARAGDPGDPDPEVRAEALADGAVERLSADIGIGITGIAGPRGGSEEKPVGTVCLSVAERAGARIDRTLQLPGNRAMVRERTTTVAMHLLRRLLDGRPD